MTTSLIPTSIDDDDLELEYYAIEAVKPGAPADARGHLVAVVGDASAKLALAAIGEVAGRHFPSHELRARIVACPGVHDPLPIYGWVPYGGLDAPEMARCPGCRRAFASVPTGMRWSVRIVDDQRGRGTEKGHGIHTCTRSDCKRRLEIVITRVTKP